MLVAKWCCWECMVPWTMDEPQEERAGLVCPLCGAVAVPVILSDRGIGR